LQENTKPTIIDCLRHGETRTTGLFCASADEKLSPKGFTQLQNSTMNGEWNAIISSPLSRCAEFAKELSANKNTPLTINPALAEMDFGDWVNQPYKKLWDEHHEALQQLWQQPDDFIAPRGESIHTFRERIIKAWENILQQHAGKKILLITHAGVIRIILSHSLAMPLTTTQSFSLRHAHYLRLAHHPDGIYSLIGHGLTT